MLLVACCLKSKKHIKSIYTVLCILLLLTVHTDHRWREILMAAIKNK